MPSKNYMVVDPRRDHSLRIPRPDLTVSIGTPNACNGCHTKKHETPKWAAQKVVDWYGPKRRDDPHYGEVLAAGRSGNPEARDQLELLAKSSKVGPIVRATAVSLLATRYSVKQSQDAIEHALKHRDELVRAAAVRAFEGWPRRSRQDELEIRKLLTPKFEDRSRLVRGEAARVALAIGLLPRAFGSSEAAALRRAIKDYKTGLMMSSDQAGAHLSMGIVHSSLGDIDKAKASYRTAIRLDPAVAGPRSNLAQLLDQEGASDEAKQLRVKEAELLARDAKLLPNHALIRYRLGLTYYVLGREKEAEQGLLDATRLDSDSTEFLMALTLLYEKQKRWPAALRAAKKLCRLDPNNPTFAQILKNIEQVMSRRQIGPALPSGR
jgi:tetratricopeptide (TPR) repeat protein